MPVPFQTRRVCWISWCWSYRWLWAGHVSTGYWIWVLWKSNKPLSRPSFAALISFFYFWISVCFVYVHTVPVCLFIVGFVTCVYPHHPCICYVCNMCDVCLCWYHSRWHPCGSSLTVSRGHHWLGIMSLPLSHHKIPLVLCPHPHCYPEQSHTFPKPSALSCDIFISILWFPWFPRIMLQSWTDSWHLYSSYRCTSLSVHWSVSGNLVPHS